MRIQRFRMLGVVLSIALMSTFAFAIAGGGTTALGAVTTLTVLSGEVTVKHVDADAFVLATDGEVIAAGDTVRTGADARALITYFEGSSVTLEPDTALVVEAAEVRGGGTIVLMTQLFGRTWHVVTKLVNGQSRYDVDTPASTASVRGTRFLVDVTVEETTISTAEGKVVAAVPAGADVVEVPVVAGMTQTQERGAPPAPPRADRTSPNASDAGQAARSMDEARGAAASADGTGRTVRDHSRRDDRLTEERSAALPGPLAAALETKRDGDTIRRRDGSARELKVSGGDAAYRLSPTRTMTERDRDRRD